MVAFVWTDTRIVTDESVTGSEVIDIESWDTLRVETDKYLLVPQLEITDSLLLDLIRLSAVKFCKENNLSADKYSYSIWLESIGNNKFEFYTDKKYVTTDTIKISGGIEQIGFISIIYLEETKSISNGNYKELYGVTDVDGYMVLIRGIENDLPNYVKCTDKYYRCKLYYSDRDITPGVFWYFEYYPEIKTVKLKRKRFALGQKYVNMHPLVIDDPFDW
ncbi:MAG: hypothetical protein K2M94_06345 [Paramuribaculum sp.]|nr:hypothetical protein [Paramuribaculum sp.]